MKTIYLMLFLIVASLCMALPTLGTPNASWQSDNPVVNPLYKWITAAALLIEADQALGPGASIFYVDSNVTTEGNGTTWATAKDTLDEAINLCTDSKGDIIYVAPGHAETWIAQACDADVIGITIIGLGKGSLRPTFTYNHANAELAIGADNVSISNCVFL